MKTYDYLIFRCEELSFYLRRRWNLSHFYVAAGFYTVGSVLGVTDGLNRASSFAIFLAILIFFAVVPVLLYYAALHDRPAAVRSGLWSLGGGLAVFSCLSFYSFVFSGVIGVLTGSPLSLAISTSFALGWLLAETPGQKVDHEPPSQLNVSYHHG